MNRSDFVVKSLVTTEYHIQCVNRTNNHWFLTEFLLHLVRRVKQLETIRSFIVERFHLCTLNLTGKENWNEWNNAVCHNEKRRDYCSDSLCAQHAIKIVSSRKPCHIHVTPISANNIHSIRIRRSMATKNVNETVLKWTVKKILLLSLSILNFHNHRSMVAWNSILSIFIIVFAGSLATIYYPRVQ